MVFIIVTLFSLLIAVNVNAQLVNILKKVQEEAPAIAAVKHSVHHVKQNHFYYYTNIISFK